MLTCLPGILPASSESLHSIQHRARRRGNSIKVNSREWRRSADVFSVEWALWLLYDRPLMAGLVFLYMQKVTEPS